MEFRTLGRRVREHFAKEKGVQIVASYASAAPAPAPVHADDGSRTGPVLEEIEREFKLDAYKIVRDLPTLEDYIRRAKTRRRRWHRYRSGFIRRNPCTSRRPFTSNRRQRRHLHPALPSPPRSARGGIVCERDPPLSPSPLVGRAGRGVQRESFEAWRRYPHPQPRPTRGRGANPTRRRTGRFAAASPRRRRHQARLNVKWDIVLRQHAIALAPYDDPMLASYTLYGGLDRSRQNFAHRKTHRPRPDAVQRCRRQRQSPTKL